MIRLIRLWPAALLLAAAILLPGAARAADPCVSGGWTGSPQPQISCAWFNERLILHLRAAAPAVVLLAMGTNGETLPDGRLHFVGMAGRGPRGDIKLGFANGHVWLIDAVVDDPKGGEPIRVHWDNSFASCSDFADSWKPCRFAAATH